MRLLWLSRHHLTDEQLKDLYRLYGKDLEIKQVDKTVEDAQEVVEAGNDCDVFAVVLSSEILSDLTNPEINSKPVIQAVSKRIRVDSLNENGESQYLFVHDHWIQISSVKIKRLGV